MDARKHLFVALLSAVAFRAAVEAACNSSQPLGQPEPVEDFVKVEYKDFMVQIELDENYPDATQKNVRIAVFNCDASDVPTIGNFVSGSQMSLGLQTEKDAIDNKWYLVVINAQDYENPNQRFYRFSVEVGGAKHDVVLNIRNLDDESPYFTLPAGSAPCSINETQTGQTSCFLLANDPDAIMDNMKFRVLEGNNPSENISLAVPNDKDLCPPANPKNCFTVAIFIKAELEFLITPVYSLLLEVEDQAGHIGNLSYVVQVIPENKDIPRFTPQQMIIELDEETPGIVDTSQTITVSDRDALDYGRFYLTLEGEGSDECYRAFDVIPKAGYRNADVMLSVIDPKTLDYDEGSCNNIIVKIKATEVTDSNRYGEATVNVTLIDLNDEPPVFEYKQYNFSALEHTPIGTHIGFVKANDRDAFDTVTYSLSSSPFLNVDPITGSVTVKADLDYSRQQQVFATVRADDTAVPPHSDFAQIVVDVIDINDKRPVLYMPWSPPDIDENTAIGTVLNVNIKAYDEDTDPDLSFSIDWGNSRAVKQGFPVDKKEFEDYLSIETVKDPEKPNDAEAVLKVNREVHWEVFDTLYVNIIVDDNNTDPDYQQNRNTSAMLTVTINDINDCYPEFNDIGNLTFKENTEEGQLFGIITATDKDGPPFNNVRYYLINDLYVEQYVTINTISGEMRTGKDPVDFEQIEVLNYTVVATDGELNRTTDITIQIEDVNDNIPYFVGDYEPVRIKENFTHEQKITLFRAFDDDKSPQFHTLRFFVELMYRGLFDVDTVTGLMIVPEGAGINLDYESNTKSYSIEVTVRDRCHTGYCYPDSVSNSTRITVELIDINDNPPVIQDAGLLASIAEDKGNLGVQLGNVRAVDIDSGINADLTFELVRFNPEEGRELFTITKQGPQMAAIFLTRDLWNKWKDYTVTVMASDPDFNDTADFIISVTDVNNNNPVFVFPDHTTVLRFNIFASSPGSVLTDVNGNKMVFSAIDDMDNGLNGTLGMTYSVIGDVTALKYLEMKGNELWLIRGFDANISRTFKLHLNACDGEFDTNQLCTPMETQVIMRFDDDFEPTFDFNEWATNFTENITGLSEVRKIDVPVTDLNNEECGVTDEYCEEDKIYYFIYDGDKETFQVNSTTGELSLKKELDREEVDTHYIVVVITNNVNGPQGTVAEDSKLRVTIHVIDVIDTAPKFNRTLFAGGISIGDKVDNVVTNFIAVSYDLNDKLTYTIIEGSMNVTDSSLQHLVGRNPFQITGDELRLNFDVQDASMRGMFVFNVLVTNLGDLTDKATCQVYIISEENLVSMRFRNEKPFVDGKRKEMADIYSNTFNSQGNVRTVARAVNSDGIPMDDQTDVTSCFVDEKVQKPIHKDEINKQLTDNQLYIKLRKDLLDQGLDLLSIEDTTNQSGSDMEGLLQTVLIVVSVVLGTLVVVLFAAFFIRTRSLNRRLEAISTTKFGSQDSGLNRIGMAVPNTNQHAVEGSNPIWGNEEIGGRHYDNVSVSSGDSDMIGVEENPEFRPYGNSGVANDGFTPEMATGYRASVNPVFASGFNPLSADTHHENATFHKGVNPLADMENNDGYDSENDSRRSSEIVTGHNSNFTFSGKMATSPTTEL